MDNSGRIQSVLPIIKSSSPAVHGHYPPAEPEPLGQKRTGLQRYSEGWLDRTVTLSRRRENSKCTCYPEPRLEASSTQVRVVVCLVNFRFYSGFSLLVCLLDFVTKFVFVLFFVFFA